MTYVTNDTRVIPMQEIVTVGIQKRTTLNVLLSSLLAAKKVANRKIANIHGWALTRLALSTAKISSAPVVVAFWDHGLSTHQIVRSSVAMTAVIPLKIAFT
jgi:hypothetical protein